MIETTRILSNLHQSMDNIVIGVNLQNYALDLLKACGTSCLTVIVQSEVKELWTGLDLNQIYIGPVGRHNLEAFNIQS